MSELSLNSLDRRITSNIYTHPANHPATIITEDATHRWFTDTERTKLTAVASGAEVNQLTFSNVKVGATIVAATSKTDTVEIIAGSNITLSADVGGRTVTINSAATPYTHPASHPGSMITEDATHRWLTDTYISTWNAKANGTHTHAGTDITSVVANATNAVNATNATNATNAVNSDTVDSLHATSFMRTDANTSTTGSISIVNAADGQVLIGWDSNGSIEVGKVGRAIAGSPYIDFHSSANSPDYDVRLGVSGGTSATIGQGILNIAAGQLKFNDGKVWHEFNDGTGSGLDADTVDGLHANQIASTADILAISMFLS